MLNPNIRYLNRNNENNVKGKQAIFEVLVVGCGGGPVETNLSSYLVKPYNQAWNEGCACVDAGSTMGSLANIIKTTPTAVVDIIAVDPHTVTDISAGRLAAQFWNYIRSVCVTHSHLDHITGLVISSAAALVPKRVLAAKRAAENLMRLFDGGIWPDLIITEDAAVARWGDAAPKPQTADSMSPPRQPTTSPPRLPNSPTSLTRPTPTPQRKPSTPPHLTSHSPQPKGSVAYYSKLLQTLPPGKAYVLEEIDYASEFYLSKGLKMRPFPLSHGMDPSKFRKSAEETENDDEHYESTAYLLTETLSGNGNKVLFFGDLEADSVSQQTYNRHIWKTVAPDIVDERLTTIFIECSYPSSQPTAQLWGHLSPPFLMEEIDALADQVTQIRMERNIILPRWPLLGVSIVVVHVKDDVNMARCSDPDGVHSSAQSCHSDHSKSSARSNYLKLAPPQPTVPHMRRRSSPYPMEALSASRRTSLVVSGDTIPGSRKPSFNTNALSAQLASINMSPRRPSLTSPTSSVVPNHDLAVFFEEKRRDRELQRRRRISTSSMSLSPFSRPAQSFSKLPEPTVDPLDPIPASPSSPHLHVNTSGHHQPADVIFTSPLSVFAPASETMEQSTSYQMAQNDTAVPTPTRENQSPYDSDGGGKKGGEAVLEKKVRATVVEEKSGETAAVDNATEEKVGHYKGDHDKFKSQDKADDEPMHHQSSVTGSGLPPQRPSLGQTSLADSISSNSTTEETIHERIERELVELEYEYQTGVTFVLAHRGMRLAF